MRFRSALIFSFFALIVALIGIELAAACAPAMPSESPTTIIEAGGAVANDACRFLEGVTQNQTLISICASVEEIALIATAIAPFLKTDDAGPCTTLPGTNVCATKALLGQGIQIVLANRARRLVLEAGSL